MKYLILKATMLALLPAMLIGCGTGGGDDDDDGGSFAESESAPGENKAALDPDRAAADRATTGSSDEAGGAAPSQAGVLDRQVIFTSDLELGAEDVTTTFHRAGQIARSVGGYVESSDLRTTGEDDDEVASVTLRVPATSLDDVLQQLRGMSDVEVRREGSHSTEITEEYTDLESRLRNLEATETRYLDLLAEAATIEEILTVTDRLDGVRAQIEQIEGRLRVLDEMVALATVTVLITPMDIAAPGNGNGGTPSPTEALADAWEWSLDAFGWVAVIAAYLAVAGAWLAAPVAAIVFLVVRGRRRQTAAETGA